MSERIHYPKCFVSLGLLAISFVNACWPYDPSQSRQQIMTPTPKSQSASVPISLVTPTPDWRWRNPQTDAEFGRILFESATDYCIVMGCNPSDLYGPSPVIIRAPKGSSICMGVYETRAFIIGDKCFIPDDAHKLPHENAHVDRKEPIRLPVEVFAKAIEKNLLPRGVPGAHGIISGARVFYVPVDSDDYERHGILITQATEEAFADLARLIYFQKKGQTVPYMYGISSDFLLFLAQRYNMDPMQIIRWKRKGNFFEFLKGITAKDNDILAAMVLERIFLGDYSTTGLNSTSPSSADEQRFIQALRTFWIEYQKYSPLR